MRKHTASRGTYRGPITREPKSQFPKIKRKKGKTGGRQRTALLNIHGDDSLHFLEEANAGYAYFRARHKAASIVAPPMSRARIAVVSGHGMGPFLRSVSGEYVPARVAARNVLLASCASGKPFCPPGYDYPLTAVDIGREMGWRCAIVTDVNVGNLAMMLVVFHATEFWANGNSFVRGFEMALERVISGRWTVSAAKRLKAFVHNQLAEDIARNISDTARKFVSVDDLFGTDEMVEADYISRDEFNIAKRHALSYPPERRADVLQGAIARIVRHNFDCFAADGRLPGNRHLALRFAFKKITFLPLTENFFPPRVRKQGRPSFTHLEAEAKDDTMKSLVTTTCVLALTASMAVAQISDDTVEMVLGAAENIDVETRENLRASLQSTADDVVYVADGMEKIRNDMLRCIGALPMVEGEVVDAMGLDVCLAEEADGARGQFIQLGNTFERAEQDLRAASDGYGRYAEMTGERIDDYRSELDELADEESELIANGKQINKYISDGHSLNSEQKEAMLVAAYKWERNTSRTTNVREIIGYLQSERALFMRVQDNLSDAADQLSAQALGSFHRAELQSDFIELVAARQGLRNIEELSIGAKADFGSLWATVGKLEGILADLGSERGQVASLPVVSEPAIEDWPAVKEDAIVNRFLSAIAVGDGSVEAN